MYTGFKIFKANYSITTNLSVQGSCNKEFTNGKAKYIMKADMSNYSKFLSISHEFPAPPPVCSDLTPSVVFTKG